MKPDDMSPAKALARGQIAQLPWVMVTRGGKSTQYEGAVHSVSSPEDIADAFGRRERASPQ